jgi:hypothetical protein
MKKLQETVGQRSGNSSQSTRKFPVSRSEFHKKHEKRHTTLDLRKPTASNNQSNKVSLNPSRKKIREEAMEDPHGEHREKKTEQRNQSTQLKNILQFEPKTEVTKQLLEEIKKLNPNN